jgi:D-arabinose 1-dehydrogenase-like Zn-dependent alcohol dehydrogenase
MAKMRAVQVATAGGPFQLVEREIPGPAAQQVRIKVEACGICHSDAIVLGGHYPGLTLPRVPGHEIAGVVDAVGPGVTAFKDGDRVGVGWHGGHCFQCVYCRKGLFLNCERARVTGIHHDGGYAEYVVVPAESVARIPEGLSAVEAGPLLCAGITTYNSLRNAGVRAGDTVAVQGIGGLGHLGIQYASRMGCRTVALSNGPDKEALARELGAHEYVDTNRVPLGEALRKLGGADLILATAPSAAAIAATIDGLKPRGKLLLVAATMEPVMLNSAALLSGRTIAGWPSGAPIDSEETLAFSKLTGVRPRTEVFPLDKVDDAFGTMMKGKVRFRAVLTP